MPAPPGERHFAAKLSNEKVAEMRRLYALGGVSILELACRYGVEAGTAGEAIRGRTWKHVPPADMKTCESCRGKGVVPL